jgi:hypothetical protein
VHGWLGSSSVNGKSTNGTCILGFSNGVALGVNGISDDDTDVYEYSPKPIIAPFLDKH